MFVPGFPSVAIVFNDVLSAAAKAQCPTQSYLQRHSIAITVHVTIAASDYEVTVSLSMGMYGLFVSSTQFRILTEKETN